ncbi:hypothetical protein P3W45_001118 [Vairimorpha bombi]
MEDNYDELVLERYTSFNPEDIDDFITTLYDDVDKMRDPRNICTRLLIDHPSNINVSKLLYFVMINYDVQFVNYYDQLLINITSINLPTNLYFVSQVLDDTNISISVLQKYVDKIILLCLECRTRDVVNILGMVYKIIKKNKILIKKKHDELCLLEESVPSISNIVRNINKLKY